MLHCQRCEYDWWPRRRNPRICPRCGSVNWNNQSTRNDYRFANIAVGQTVVYEWFLEEDGFHPDSRKNQNRYNAFHNFCKRSGRVFKTESLARGFVITRIS